MIRVKLWFDVGIKRYTTSPVSNYDNARLWFDVGIKRYTTFANCSSFRLSCGLM